jgi:hypothetical protein
MSVMQEIDRMRRRLEVAGDLTDLLEASWDAFGLLMAGCRDCQDRSAELFAAFAFAAAAANAGLRAVAAAPSLPAGLGDGTGADSCVLADPEMAADGLASLAQALRGQLVSAAERARDPGDRQACQEAAEQAAQVCGLLARDT